MFEIYQRFQLIAVGMINIFRRILLVLMTTVKVTVLFFIIAKLGAVQADETSRTDMRLFEFTSEFYLPTGDGRLDGLMASDGSRQRIVIYWIEPTVYHDNTFFLGYSDFIFEEDVVHYLIRGMSQPSTFNLSDKESVPLLPRDTSVESVARSVLAIVSRIKSQSEQGDIPLEVGKFFQQSRNKVDYSYEVPSEQVISDESSINSVSDEQILNALPYGRKYSKETQSDGTIVWQAQRVLEGPHVARITVKSISITEYDCDRSMFDPNTLGHWTFIPEPYRAYWLFDRSYSELKDTPDNVASRELYEKVESFINKHDIPDRLDLSFNQLLFKTALLTSDKHNISNSAHDVVSALCRDSSMNSYQSLFELAQIDDQIREKYPEQADEIVCPLIAQMVRHTGRDISRALEQLILVISMNKWFSYGRLLVDEARIQGLIENDIADTFASKLQASRLARTRQPVDSCEECESVKQYMAKISEDPPKGNLSMEDIREILEKGLTKPFADANLDSKDEVIENTVHSIRLIAGEGPFRGEKVKLIKSIERFSGLYLLVFRYQEPIDTVLATFLALSFCDTSTTEDHDVLFSQIQNICSEFQVLTNKMLNDRGLAELVPPNDVDRLFNRYKQRFRNYIDDPLWPPFKFPMTANEQTRLRNKLILRFSQLEPVFDEMGLKVKYGGVNDELKQRTCYEIASAILQILPQAAFLRRPSYPGVSCQHRGRYGFTAAIRGPLYIEGERPREKFKAMKYFHLGHRLEEIVKRERELATSR
jgi:hypothetical protein